jgi:hypothetical protein
MNLDHEPNRFRNQDSPSRLDPWHAHCNTPINVDAGLDTPTPPRSTGQRSIPTTVFYLSLFTAEVRCSEKLAGPHLPIASH